MMWRKSIVFCFLMLINGQKIENIPDRKSGAIPMEVHCPPNFILEKKRRSIITGQNKNGKNHVSLIDEIVSNSRKITGDIGEVEGRKEIGEIGDTCLLHQTEKPTWECDKGYELVHEQCVKKLTDMVKWECKAPSVFDKKTLRCVSEDRADPITVCPADRILDVSTQKCIKNIKVLPSKKCPDGFKEFDDETCILETQVAAERSCPQKDYTFDTKKEKCIKNLYEEVIKSCPLRTYLSGDTCVPLQPASPTPAPLLSSAPQSTPSCSEYLHCPTDYLFDSASQTCKLFSQVDPVCPPNHTLNRTTLKCELHLEVAPSRERSCEPSPLLSSPAPASPPPSKKNTPKCPAGTYQFSRPNDSFVCLQCPHGYLLSLPEGEENKGEQSGGGQRRGVSRELDKQSTFCYAVDERPPLYQCEQGFFYDKASKQCIQLLNEPKQRFCPHDFEPQQEHCYKIEQADAFLMCPKDYIMERGRCVSQGESEGIPSCADGYRYVYGECLRLESAMPLISCPSGYRWRSSSRVCEHYHTVSPDYSCPKGYVANPDLSLTCIPVKK